MIKNSLRNRKFSFFQICIGCHAKAVLEENQNKIIKTNFEMIIRLLFFMNKLCQFNRFDFLEAKFALIAEVRR